MPAFPIPVYFLILPDTLLLDVAGISEALRVASQLSARDLFASRYVGPAAQVPSSVGLQLASIETLPARIEDDAWIVVCGLRAPEAAVRGEAVRTAVRWLQSVVRARHTLVCVCAGALVAAEAGLLEGRACTSHHDHTAWLALHHPGTRVLENRLFVRDGNIYTSAGVTSGVDLALSLIAEHAGEVTAARVARDLVVYIRRTGSDPQISSWLEHRNHLNPVVHRAQDLIVEEPARDWTLSTIAAAASVSVRTLSRQFREETGTTPMDFVRQIRMAIAKEQLLTGQLSVERVAERAGFRSALQLRRTARQSEGVTPRQIRKNAQRLQTG
jgi:transcriptional regulator GlxA family with amidase domain